MTLKHRIGKAIIPALQVDRRTFDILRLKAKTRGTCWINVLSPNGRGRIGRIRTLDERNVSVGSCGPGGHFRVVVPDCDR
jgi:hypothetical protein